MGYGAEPVLKACLAKGYKGYTVVGTACRRVVIFDCDGVLVDSEPISLAVDIEVFAAAGCDLTPAEGYANLLGRSLESAALWLKEAKGFELTDPVMWQIRTRLFERLRAELRPIAHVAEIIPKLHRRVCVASSSTPDRIHLSLSLTGLHGFFAPNIFSASMVEHGKPAPDLFLFAARKMGVTPENCTVIEDSPAGIIAAKAAGMQVIGFVGGGHAEPAGLSRAVANCAPDAIISDMADLPALLQALA